MRFPLPSPRSPRSPRSPLPPLLALLAAGLLQLGAADDPLATLASYERSQGCSQPAAVARLAHAASPGERPGLERQLIAVLADPKATSAAKGVACDQLAIIGSAACVPALAPLLTDEALSMRARNALLPLPDASVLPALHAALEAAAGRTRAGIAGDLGRRRDATALGTLARLAADADAGVASAAITALRDVGGKQAATALAALPLRPGTQAALQDGLLTVASGLAASDAAIALELLHGVAAHGSIAVRCAAWRIAAGIDVKRTLADIIPCLADEDQRLGSNLIGLLSSLPQSEVGGSLAAALPTLPAAGQQRALEILRRRHDSGAATAVATLAAPGAQAALRLAALETLGVIGGPGQLEVLLQATQDADAAVASAGRSALANCPHPDLPSAIAARLGGVNGRAREELAFAGASHRLAPAIAALIPLAAGDGPAAEAARSLLGRVAGAEHLDALVALIASSHGAEANERLWAEVLKRLPNRTGAAKALIALHDASQGQVHLACLRILGLTGTAEALATLATDVKDADLATVDAAVRALVAWPEVDAVPQLLAITAASANPTHRTLALRGIARLADLPDRTPEQHLAVLRQALAAVTRPEERKQLLGAAGRVPSLDALQLLEPALKDAAVQEEAFAAWIAVAHALAANKQAEQAAQALERLIAATSGAQRERAREEKAQLPGKGRK